MPSNPCRHFFALLALAAAAASSAMAADGPQMLILDNGSIRLEATPAFGGRVLSWHLAGEPNVLKVGQDAIRNQPRPQWSASAGDIPYLGHDVWVGPQSQWWLHQEANPARRQAAANWPPDPYLSLAPSRVVAQGPSEFTLEGVASPITGVRLRKSIRLAEESADTVIFQAQAQNIRDSAVAWDLWFNSRVAASTRVFVPVASPEKDMDLKASTDPGTTAPTHAWEQGMFTLSAARSDSPAIHRGKYRIQPSAGWMAGFAGHQVFLIRFEHQPRERIHPEQGQVELYLDAASRAPAEGLLEMEVHAPYRQLKPGERMQASERWTLLRYDGPDDVRAQRAFLCEQSTRLDLTNACVPEARIH